MLAVQFGVPIHFGNSGSSLRSCAEAAAVISLLSTPSAADIGRHVTDAALPAVAPGG